MTRYSQKEKVREWFLMCFQVLLVSQSYYLKEGKGMVSDIFLNFASVSVILNQRGTR